MTVAQVHRIHVSYVLEVRLVAKASSTTQLHMSGLWVEDVGVVFALVLLRSCQHFPPAESVEEGMTG